MTWSVILDVTLRHADAVIIAERVSYKPTFILKDVLNVVNYHNIMIKLFLKNSKATSTRDILLPTFCVCF